MKTNKHLIFGLHSVEGIVQNQPERIIKLCVQQERGDKKMSALVQLARKQGVLVEQLSQARIGSSD